jgi:hypothetical protein
MIEGLRQRLMFRVVRRIELITFPTAFAVAAVRG